MPRLIDADVLIQDLKDRKIPFNADINEAIICAPTVDAEPVRYGHWIENDNGTYSCSECYSWIPNEQHYYARYCLHCGAKLITPLSRYERGGICRD